MNKKRAIKIDKNISVHPDDGCWWADTVMLKFWKKTGSRCRECPFETKDDKLLCELRGTALRKFLVEEIERMSNLGGKE